MHNNLCNVRACSQPPTWRKIIPLIGGFLFNLTFGSIYTFGNLSLYVTSYMRWVGDDNVRIKNFSWVYSSAVSSLGLMMFFGGMLQEWIGIRRCAVLGAILFSLSVTLSSWTVCSLPWFTLTFGILFGLADGLSYSCPIAAAYKWWPNKRGLVTGIVLAGTSMSTLVFGPLQGLIVNPGNKVPTACPYPEFPKELYFQDHEILTRVPWIFFILGVIFFVISLSSALSMGDPPVDYEARFPFFPDSFNKKTIDKSFEYQQSISPSQLIFYKEFWIVWSILMLHGQFIIYLSFLWKIIGLSEVGISDKNLSLIGNVLISVANTSGRLAWGSFADYISVRILLMANSGLAMLVLASYPLIMQNRFLFYIWISLLNFCIGGTFISIPTATSRIFGAKHFPANYGIVYTARVASAIVVSIIFNNFYSTLSTVQFCFLLSLCAALSGFLAYVCDAKKFAIPLYAKKAE